MSPRLLKCLYPKRDPKRRETSKTLAKETHLRSKTYFQKSTNQVLLNWGRQPSIRSWCGIFEEHQLPTFSSLRSHDCSPHTMFSQQKFPLTEILNPSYCLFHSIWAICNQNAQLLGDIMMFRCIICKKLNVSIWVLNERKRYWEIRLKSVYANLFDSVEYSQLQTLGTVSVGDDHQQRWAGEKLSHCCALRPRRQAHQPHRGIILEMKEAGETCVQIFPGDKSVHLDCNSTIQLESPGNVCPWIKSARGKPSSIQWGTREPSL